MGPTSPVTGKIQEAGDLDTGTQRQKWRDEAASPEPQGLLVTARSWTRQGERLPEPPEGARLY